MYLYIHLLDMQSHDALLTVLLLAHMWYDHVTIEADTTEDQSGVAHNKVRYTGCVLSGKVL